MVLRVSEHAGGTVYNIGDSDTSSVYPAMATAKIIGPVCCLAYELRWWGWSRRTIFELLVLDATLNGLE